MGGDPTTDSENIDQKDFAFFKDGDLENKVTQGDLENKVKFTKIISTLHFATIIQYIKFS